MSLSARRVPTVDLSDYVSGAPEARAGFVKCFGDALREFGFVSVANHGVDDGLIRRTYADAEALFALPREVKNRYRDPSGGGQRGYTGLGEEHAKNRAIGDLKEFWHVGRDGAGMGQNLWPPDDELPSLRASTLALYEQLDRAAAHLLVALGDYLGGFGQVIAGMAKGGNSILRIIHYPPLRDLFVPGAVRAAEHEDINLLTLLCEGTASGLEILTRDGDWLPVDTIKGQIVVDSGDMLQRITRGVIPSTTHRVVNPSAADEDRVRYSMPFFVHPYPSCELRALPLAEAADVPELPAITADEFLKQRLREIGLLKS